jgi:sulfonate transport system ATP-binding protein
MSTVSDKDHAGAALARKAAPWIVPLVILVAWEIAAKSGVLSTRVLPEPLAVVKAAWSLIESGEMWADVKVSTWRAVSGFAIGGGIGFVLGLGTGLFKPVDLALDTTVQMIRNIPALAMIPLLILWFGIEEEAKVFLVALGVFFPIYVNTYHGIRSVDANLIEMARSYGVKRFALYRDVILPGALPSILVGVRFAFGLMWVTLIVAETISAQSGIGYMTMNAREFLKTDVVVVGILLYAALGKLADMLAKGLERVSLRWHPAFESMSASRLSASFGGIAGADLEAELQQPRTHDRTATEAAAAAIERDAVTLHDRIADGDRSDALALRKSGRNAQDVSVELRGVGKRYGERAVLADFDLSIGRGSFVSIVGRSGCGKSTLLRLIAGLEAPTSGTLDKHADGTQPFDTRIMFQDARLLPWKTVLQNVMLGLGRSSRDHARAVLAEVGLLERANDWPAQLSGGQRQRVALARSLVHRPQLLLLDEPLGALDALTRIEMHALIERLWREHRFTALLVTHDVQEAVALGDRILLIEEGRIALDQHVPLFRPRERASAAFAALEARVLERVMQTRAAGEPASDASPDAGARNDTRSVHPRDIRWAV